MKKLVYSFEMGDKSWRDLLGGKGANLAEMTKIGLPVPQGFTVSTEACKEYYEKNQWLSENVKSQIAVHMMKLEESMGKKFGGDENPLLVSVRSGAAVSMPGMMDTVLNLGLNDTSVEALARESQNEKFAWDSYRRFIQMFSDVVMDIPKYKFDIVLERLMEEKGCDSVEGLEAEDFKKAVEEFKGIYVKETGNDFLTDPFDQLLATVEAVFKSWNNPRAIVYRDINGIDGSIGTAVNIQSMVFGNLGQTSGTGVAFTRNPATGEKKIFGEYLLDAQGEDVVAGIRTPKEIEGMADEMPEVYKEFMDVCALLEKHYNDMQDIEFTIEKGKLYLLQTRNGKRTAQAAIKVAVDMVEEGLISKDEAILRVDPSSINQLLHKNFDPKELKKERPLTEGLPASPGAASGRVAFTANDIKQGKGEILVRLETSPEDIEGMNLAEGILTIHGGMTSHAAVVARGMGKCCISGCSSIELDEAAKRMVIGDVVIQEGDCISLDGGTGKVYKGEIPKREGMIDSTFEKFMEWTGEYKSLGIRTNADTVKDCETAIRFGAEGIGLCRTEHMFFDENKIWPVREMIVSKTSYEREQALAKLLPLQKEDFVGIFKTMGARPVTVRLLDPPLHEFLPHEDDDIEKLSKDMNIEFRDLKNRIEGLKEFNPMLGHRGCRLAVTYPEIYEMQAKAIMLAAIENKRNGVDVSPEIMIPLVGEVNELTYVKKRVQGAIEEVFRTEDFKLEYKLGTMIEVPRACVTSDEIAKEAEFFSFGTNDLTQITFGYSRDDSPKFIGEYKSKEILAHDPFESIDERGVGRLMKMSVDLAKAEKGNIKLGICGEHGGDPKSIEFCHGLGLDYVSCSPYRVPIARVAAAQAEIKSKRG
ncbi:pyruvate, phosphate dikinase [Propionigenium maris DSM 9537]|uniref:Pyruvate, phosphate dikinase n=1 Tax=Propionigenium maris DSM 9537 TaxID=1123000 RepID=A0A9W6LNP8_9FUSO|nr:pyruvate, phosphate dikinase [Propionigenium maris]GLI57124.1 pyruvate, phosphate dikinase [Propionigenium maris DSM 9537]